MDQKTRWQEKAEKLRAEIEASHALITRPALIKRRACVRWVDSIDGRTEHSAYVYKEQVRAFVRNCAKNGGKNIRYMRIWTVVEENPFSTEPHEVVRWERLIMAQAVRDARNFLHAKWLMIDGLDAATNDLSAGVKPRRW